MNESRDCRWKHLQFTTEGKHTLDLLQQIRVFYFNWSDWLVLKWKFYIWSPAQWVRQTLIHSLDSFTVPCQFITSCSVYFLSAITSYWWARCWSQRSGDVLESQDMEPEGGNVDSARKCHSDAERRRTPEEEFVDVLRGCGGCAGYWNYMQHEMWLWHTIHSL